MSEDLQFYPVDSDLGLLVCHGGINDTALPEELRSSTTCQESSIPGFIQGFLIFLWTMMAFCIAAFFCVIYYLTFMQRGKEKVLKIKNQRQEETNGSHKFATIRVYASLLYPLLSLIIDYISDFAFIHALVFDFPFDSQFIHLSKPAVGALVFYEIFAIIAFPLTAVMLLIWLNTREGFYEDIQQKMLISSIMYLLDDGPETLLQYFFIDKFSGTDYSYPDGFKTSFKTAILASSIVTFGLAFLSFVRLTLRYKDLILQQKRDGIKFKKS
jgi:preprotein translocase subunit SecG